MWSSGREHPRWAIQKQNGCVLLHSRPFLLGALSSDLLHLNSGFPTNGTFELESLITSHRLNNNTRNAIVPVDIWMNDRLVKAEEPNCSNDPQEY